VEGQLGIGPAVELASERQAQHLVAAEPRAARARLPGAAGEEVLLNQRGEAMFGIEQRAHGRELGRVHVADPGRGERQLLRVAHSGGASA
jgi:hypothetical protein